MGIAFKEIEIEGKKFRALVDTGFIGEVGIYSQPSNWYDRKNRNVVGVNHLKP